MLHVWHLGWGLAPGANGASVSVSKTWQLWLWNGHVERDRGRETGRDTDRDKVNKKSRWKRWPFPSLASEATQQDVCHILVIKSESRRPAHMEGRGLDAYFCGRSIRVRGHVLQPPRRREPRVTHKAGKEGEKKSSRGDAPRTPPAVGRLGKRRGLPRIATTTLRNTDWISRNRKQRSYLLLT